MAGTLSLVSIIAMILSIICLIATIVVFIVFKIPAVYGDLSGKTARKSIEQMRKENEKKGTNAYRSKKRSQANVPQAKASQPVRPQAPVYMPPQSNVQTADIEKPETGILSSNQFIPNNAGETAVLGAADGGNVGATVVLNPDAPYMENNYSSSMAKEPAGVYIEMLDEVIFTQTSEVIQ